MGNELMVVQPIVPFRIKGMEDIASRFNLPKISKFVLCYLAEYNKNEDNLNYRYVIYATESENAEDINTKFNKDRIIYLPKVYYIRNTFMQKLAAHYSKDSIAGFRHNSKVSTVLGTKREYSCIESLKYLQDNKEELIKEFNGVIAKFVNFISD